MIEDILEAGIEGASESKSGGVFIFIMLLTLIGIGVAIYTQTNLADKCSDSCPTNFKIKKEMCFCEEGGKWNLKEFGK